MVPTLSDASQLEEVCAEIAAAAFVGLDTEFMRERTYFAQLALVQIALPGRTYLLDPLTADLHGLGAALATGRGIKVLHAGRQDLELLLQETAALPQPLFDTQLAAGLVGFDEQIGYAELVEKLLGVHLNKDATRTNWAARPLSDRQLTYARDDVVYLEALYTRLDEDLRAKGRRAWLDEDCAALTDPALYRFDPHQLVRRYRQGITMAPAAQAIFTALLCWREQAARTVNLPRGWVVADTVLVDLAQHPPPDLAALAHGTGLDERAVRRFGEALLTTVATAGAAPPRAWPARTLDADGERRYAALVAVVDRRAQELGVAASLIGSRRLLKDVVQGAPPGALARGWRAEVLGGDGLALLGPEH
ncbi:MAG: ribonuclease D [Acidiferrobacter sp.]